MSISACQLRAMIERLMSNWTTVGAAIHDPVCGRFVCAPALARLPACMRVLVCHQVAELKEKCLPSNAREEI